MIVDVTSTKPFHRDLDNRQIGDSAEQAVQRKQEDTASPEQASNIEEQAVQQQAQEKSQELSDEHIKTNKSKRQQQQRAQDQLSSKADKREGDKAEPTRSTRKREAASETSSEADEQEDHHESEPEGQTSSAATPSEEHHAQAEPRTNEVSDRKDSNINSMNVSKEIGIPNNLVGILLRKQSYFAPYMYKIGAATRTRIWRARSGPKPSGEEQADPEQDTGAEDDEDIPAADTQESSEGKLSKSSTDQVIFVIRGHSEEAVNEAYTILQRIIAGERILEVLPKRQHSQPQKQKQTPNQERKGYVSKKSINRKRDDPVENVQTS